ncbi:synaptic vesicle 2-related protein isoform X5 [Varanus komodoensis]|uniref:synaptic vesicle 2-related protein isoform X5 n=1 Tax=Varanus komodoensis TaxID=61221 RepID=UPI001CF780A7|nr:synaptic vesicle 2-related protein isoform X5 [Varanus komodoensis]
MMSSFSFPLGRVVKFRRTGESARSDEDAISGEHEVQIEGIQTELEAVELEDAGMVPKEFANPTDDTFMVEDAVEAIGFGKFQWKLSILTGLAWMADAMEMMILSILAPQLHCGFHGNDVQFNTLGKYFRPVWQKNGAKDQCPLDLVLWDSQWLRTSLQLDSGAEGPRGLWHWRGSPVSHVICRIPPNEIQSKMYFANRVVARKCAIRRVIWEPRQGNRHIETDSDREWGSDASREIDHLQAGRQRENEGPIHPAVQMDDAPALVYMVRGWWEGSCLNLFALHATRGACVCFSRWPCSLGAVSGMPQMEKRGESQRPDRARRIFLALRPRDSCGTSSRLSTAAVLQRGACWPRVLHLVGVQWHRGRKTWAILQRHRGARKATEPHHTGQKRHHEALPAVWAGRASSPPLPKVAPGQIVPRHRKPISFICVWCRSLSWDWAQGLSRLCRSVACPAPPGKRSNRCIF